MRIIKVRDDSGIDMISPMLSDTYEGSKDDFVSLLKQLVATEEMYFLIALSDDETIDAFVVAYLPSTAYVALLASWDRTGDVESVISRKLFFRVQMWADMHGVSIIRAESSRNNKDFLKARSFEKVSVIMEHHIPKDFDLGSTSNG